MRSGTTQPSTGSQIRQGSQATSPVGMQLPAWHDSPVVQKFSSAHGVPSAAVDWQSAAQQSPPTALPSSQDSPGSTTPLPQSVQISRLHWLSDPASLASKSWMVSVHVPAASSPSNGAKLSSGSRSTESSVAGQT